jgi:serine/threonine protein kinase
MPLSLGNKLGHYEILTPPGAGGMDEVYLTRDIKLDREVDIQLLPAALGQDPERLARFEREAKVPAILDHPNIAHIYGVEGSGGVGGLVMGLVPGAHSEWVLVRLPAIRCYKLWSQLRRLLYTLRT